MGAWEEHEQAELKRQAEWLRKERAKAQVPVKPKQTLLGRLKALFGKGGRTEGEEVTRG